MKMENVLKNNCPMTSVSYRDIFMAKPMPTTTYTLYKRLIHDLKRNRQILTNNKRLDRK